MARVRIISSSEVHELPVSNLVHSAVIPIDGDFHEIHNDLVQPLLDSGAQIEVEAVEPEIENADATGGTAAAGGAAGLGGSAAPLSQLDHDHDGKAGGSLPGDASTAAKGAKRKKAKKAK